MNIRGKTGSVSADNVISEEQLYNLFSESTDKDKVLVALMGFYGLREGETIHFRKDWIHINDSEAKFLNGNHIKVPSKGTKCNCSDCWLRVYRKIRASEEPDKKKRNNKWKLEVQKDYYKLRNEEKEKDVIRKALHHEKKPGQKKGWKPHWRPKSLGGALPTTDDNVQQVIVDFYNNNEKIGLSRIQIWTRIRKLGKRILGIEELSPHYLRATYLTLIARKGASPITVQGAGRWATTSPAKHYVKSEEKAMFKEIREINNRDVSYTIL